MLAPERSYRAGMTPLPPHNKRFAHGSGAVIWAAVMQLDEGEQHELLSELQDHLAMTPTLKTTQSARRLRAIENLRRAAELLGESPSMNAYRALRSEHPDEGLIADGSIRHALGGTWNDCLTQAHLDTVSDGDALALALGGHFRPSECIEALRACAQEIGTVPGMSIYLSWAHRPDVRRRPGRRPQSVGTFGRVFGGFREALVEAGLLAASGNGARTTSVGAVRFGTHFISDEAIVTGLREVAERLGHSPQSVEYVRERTVIIEESRAAGQLRTIAAYATVLHRFGSWDAALAAAGLIPPPAYASKRTPVSDEGRPVLYSDAEILAAVRQAYLAEGGYLTIEGYRSWRRTEMRRDRELGIVPRKIPAYQAIWRRFGSFRQVVARALAETATETNIDGQ